MRELQVPASLRPAREKELRPPTTLYVIVLVLGLLGVGVLVSSFSSPQWLPRLIGAGTLLTISVLGLLALTGSSRWPGRCLAGMLGTAYSFNLWEQATRFEDSPRALPVLASALVAFLSFRYAFFPPRKEAEPSDGSARASASGH